MRCRIVTLGGSLLMVTACGGGMRGAQPFEVSPVRVESAAPLPRSQQDARVVVRRASMEVEVEAVGPAVDRATALAQSFEGYVENVTTHEDKNASLRLRVPSTRLNEALDSPVRLGTSLSQITLFVKRRVVLGPLGIVAAAIGTVIAKLFIWR